MKIHGFNKTTLLDYPGHLASTLFLGGCNLRCPFCQNASLVLHPEDQPIIPIEDVLSTLKKRKNILEGVCITGGEPGIQKDLPELIKTIKSLGLKVKLDTNGTNPSLLQNLMAENLLDYIAMDIKNSKNKYPETVGLQDFDISKVLESVELILNSSIDYEFRTTVVKEFHKESDFMEIGQWLKGAKAYYLQAYKDSGDIIMGGFSSYDKEKLILFKDILDPYIHFVALRGID